MGGGGGGYGGYGGFAANGASGGTAYGNVLQPSDVGSPASGLNQSDGHALGGGGLHLTVLGTLSLNGRISADGAASPLQGGGGGSGGSVWLTTRTLSGSGLVSASGGAGDPGQGGGGGGGRVAVYYTSNLFTGTFSAHGGSGTAYGGAGTVYSKANNAGVGQLVIDNAGFQGTNTPLATPEAFNLSVLNGSIVNPGPPTLPGTLPLIVGTLLVDSGGVLTHFSSQSNLDLIVLGNALINTNGSINVDTEGYYGVNGGPGAGLMTNTYSGGGGGYGGAGGAGISGIPGGSTYGSAQQPTDTGSRGGVFPIIQNFCQGGGAIRLRVGGALSVNGSISANGNAALIEGGGGGSGGSVWLTARAINGTGLILANGGAGEAGQGGGGGGGRIAINSRTNNFTGLVTAFGGPGASPGGNGTIVITNIPSPQVIAQTPTDLVYYAVSNVDLTFSSPMDATTISPSDALLDTPNGLLPQNELNAFPLSLMSARLSFPPQNILGFYQFQVGPQIQDIYGIPMDSAYIGDFIIWAPTISGQVTDTNGLPVQYVTIRPDGGLLPAVTDVNGAYSLQVPPSWVGTITPAKGTALFIPQLRSYAGVSASLTNQNFILVSPAMLTITQQVQGTNLNLSWFGLNGVTYQTLYSTDMLNWLPYQGPMLGTNGPMTCVCPMGSQPAMFFRFSTSY